MPKADYTRIHKALLAWYRQHGRHDLPWRKTKDPYAIYISEIMLQQTQVATVLARYYHPFLKRFPTLAALAGADEREVLKAWEGLGYYTRARNVHKAAKQAGKNLPETVAELLLLPGIGRNTAHAVAAFAHHLPVPVLEANVKRVIARFFALEKPSQEEWWQRAAELLDETHPFDYNQAMMDVGALICTPKEPKCGQCPLRSGCSGKHAPEHYPAKAAPRKKTPVRERILLALIDEKGRIGLALREEGRLLAGLYGLPQLEEEEWKKLKPSLEAPQLLGRVAHQYSHFRLEGSVWAAPARKPLPAANISWYSPARLKELPLSRADHKALKLIIDQTRAKPQYTR